MSLIHVDNLSHQPQELLPPLGGQTTPRGKSLLEDVSMFALIGTTAIRPKSGVMQCNRVGY